MDGQGEDRAFTWLTCHSDISTHVFCQTTRDCQTDACTGRWFSTMAVFHLIIHGEDFVLLILRNADAGIFHFKVQNAACIVTHAHGHLALLGKFHRVADQVPQDLAQTRAVSHYFMRQRQGRVEHKTQSFLLRLQAGEILQIGHEAGEIHRLVIQLNLTPLHLIHINDIVEDIPQRHGGDMDSFQVFFLLRRQVSVQQNAAQTDNSVQRCAQFVADGGNKGSFIAAGALKRILIALALGNISTKTHQTMTFTDAIVIRHFADFKTGFAPIRIIEPLLIGQRHIMAKDFFIGFNDLFGRFRRVHISRL